MKSNKKKRMLIFVLITETILLLVAASFIIYFFVFRNRDTYDESDYYSGVNYEGDYNTAVYAETEEWTEASTETATETTTSTQQETTEVTTENSTENPTTKLDTLVFPENEEDWCLILVNKDNPVPDNYSIEFTVLSNGKQVDKRIYPQLQAMFDDARSCGMDLFVREAYRTAEDQQQIKDERIQSFIDEGYTYEEALNYTMQYVAEPGTSEHQLGISVDINANNEVSEDDTIYTWLDENAYKYGFIKRYPENKIDITGINNEPWHYRYVGQKAAKEMKEKDLCLEEYLEAY